MLVPSNAIGLIYLDPRLSIAAQHGARLTTGIAEFDLCKELNVMLLTLHARNVMYQRISCMNTRFGI